MPTKGLVMLMFAAVAAIAFQPARAQSGKDTAKAGTADKTSSTGTDAPDRAKTLRAAADALGMVRWSDIGAGGSHLPAVDVVNTVELWGDGTTYGPPLSSKAGEPWPAFKTEYHVALGYNPPAIRREMTRPIPGAPAQSGTVPLHTIQVVRDQYAWDESEMGAGLVPGKGAAIPAMGEVNTRLLQLWILPYGVVKAALAAGEKTKISTENEATVITFPLSGQLVGVMVKATLDAKNEVVKVETRADNPALGGMLTETEYSEYADHGEILTDIKSPGHIIQRQGVHTVLDVQLKKVDANNPYLIFPVPENVRKAASH
jgi:hypothetical protein